MMSSAVCEKSTAVPEFPWSLQAAAGRTPFAGTNRWQCGLVTQWLALNRFCAVQHRQKALDKLNLNLASGLSAVQLAAGSMPHGRSLLAIEAATFLLTPAPALQNRLRP